LNHLLSLGLDAGWRAWAARSLRLDPGAEGPFVLDLASGTGDLALALRNAGMGRILRLDLSPSLLEAGRRKLRDSSRAGGGGSPGLAAEMDHLPLREASVSAVAQGFALRHCRDYVGFFSEIRRVLKPGGEIALLDMRYPESGPGSRLYRFYFRAVLPRLASLLGGDRRAYEMMVDSVRALPREETLCELLTEVGFEEVASRAGVFGAVRLLTARKPLSTSLDWR
jgi:demethylmenaquinone methyltransferase/2-methoxy-6-polyprenyl-1,4-benzoquinol methylase